MNLLKELYKTVLFIYGFLSIIFIIISLTNNVFEFVIPITNTQSFKITFTLNSFLTILILATVTILIIIGVNVLGSGISSTSIYFIFKIILYYLIWLFMGLFVTSFLSPLGIFSTTFTTICTIIYSIGIIENITSSSTDIQIDK